MRVKPAKHNNVNDKQKEEFKERVEVLDNLTDQLDEQLPTEGVKDRVHPLANIRNGVALQSYLLKNLYTDLTGENPWQ